MTEIYNSNLEDAAREGLLSLWAEAQKLGDNCLGGKCFEELLELDRRTCKEKLKELRTEINNLVNTNGA